MSIKEELARKAAELRDLAQRARRLASGLAPGDPAVPRIAFHGVMQSFEATIARARRKRRRP